MCGIFGYINIDQKYLLNKMKESLHHRGHDDSGLYQDHKISFGMTRLSINGLQSGHQPMFSKDQSIALIVNGEIYNSPQLRVFLENLGYSFNSKSDVEVILYLYEEYGPYCFNFISGMYACAIIDFSKKKLIISRDPIGIKPLYFSIINEKFLFASELKAICQYNKLNPKLNLRMMYPHSYFDYGSWTHIEQIKELMPGHLLIVDYEKELKIETKRYHDFEFKTYNYSFYGKDKVREKLRTMLEESVSHHLLADVDIGFLLSGGVDSNLITQIGSKFLKKKFNTFTFGSEDKNEFSQSRKMAERYDSQHFQVSFNTSDVLENIISVMYHLETSEPRVFDSSIPTYLLFNEVKKYNKVVLCGEGSDEIFCGYLKYFLPLEGQPVALSNEVERHFRSLYRLNLKRVDKMSMAHSVEARVPFLSQKFTQFALSIEAEAKIHQNKDKKILREIAEQFLPNEIAWAKKEQTNTGSGMPIIMSKWLNSIGDRHYEKLIISRTPRVKKSYIVIPEKVRICSFLGLRYWIIC